MSIRLPALEVPITLDKSGFDKGLGVIKGLALGAITAIGAGIVGATALGVKAALESARVDELAAVNQVLAKNAGIAGEAVKSEAEEVRKMGIEYGTSQQVVAKFIQSQLDLAKASDLARVAQDAAVISGENSTQALDGIVHGIVTLQPEVLRNHGIIVNLEQAYKEYADSIGKTSNELTYQEKQQIALNAVLKQGTNIMGSYETAMQEPSKVLRSMPRYINDILVVAGEPFKEVFGDMIFMAAEFTKGLGEALAEGGALRPILESIASGIKPMTAAAREWVENIDWNKVGEAVKTGKKAWDSLGVTWNTTIVPLAKQLAVLWDLLTQIGQRLDKNTDGVAGKFTVFGAALRILVGFGGAVQVFFNIMETGLRITNTLLDAAIGLWDRFTGSASRASSVSVPTGNIGTSGSLPFTPAPTRAGRSPGRATGGAVASGVPYNILELGKAEVFTPHKGGRIGDEIKATFSDTQLNKLGEVVGNALGRKLVPALQRAPSRA